MTAGYTELMIVAGEASGDDHAAELFRQLKTLRPDVRAFGLAGDGMIAAGVEPVGHSSTIAVVGLVEALKVLAPAKDLFRRLLSEAEARGTRTALLVDSPGFNLRLAKALHQRGVRVLYYISPQLWAWREKRVGTVRQCVDEVLVLFDFEVDWYRQHGVEAVHVGHPLVDAVPRLESAWDRCPADRSPQAPVVTLMPGSRRNEIERLLPEMAGAARVVSAGLPQGSEPRFQVIRARDIDAATLAGPIRQAGLGFDIEMIEHDRYQAIADSHLVICASGTATLEVGLLGTPMLVAYKLQGLTHVLARRVVRTPYFSLVNLVLKEEVVPEMLQRAASAESLGSAALDLLLDRRRVDRMREQLSALRPALGRSGASARAAAEVARVLEEEG